MTCFLYKAKKPSAYSKGRTYRGTTF